MGAPSKAAGKPRRGLAALAEALFWPVHALAVFTGAKTFYLNPVIGSRVLNRRGLHVWRIRATHAITARRRARLAHLVSETDRAAFERDGFVMRRNVLPEAEFQAFRDAVYALQAPAREMVEGDAVTRQISVTRAVLARTPELRLLLDHPAWRGLTRYVGGFDADPILNVQTIFARAAPGPDDPQTRLHIDTFHPTMKAWFFLDDVGADEGPLTYVPGSHRLAQRRLAWQKRRSILASTPPKKGGSFRVTEKAFARLDLPEPVRFTAPGNTLVVADTFGFHARGQAARPSRRIEIYASMRPNPFNPWPGVGVDRLPFVRGRKETIGWAMTDLAVRLGLGPAVWRDAGRIGPTDPPQALGGAARRD